MAGKVMLNPWVYGKLPSSLAAPTRAEWKRATRNGGTTLSYSEWAAIRRMAMRSGSGTKRLWVRNSAYPYGTDRKLSRGIGAAQVSLQKAIKSGDWAKVDKYTAILFKLRGTERAGTRRRRKNKSRGRRRNVGNRKRASRQRRRSSRRRRNPDRDTNLATLRRIVAEKQSSNVHAAGGKHRRVTMDLFSASAILAVYDKLSAVNQAKFEPVIESDPRKAASIAFKLMK